MGSGVFEPTHILRVWLVGWDVPREGRVSFRELRLLFTLSTLGLRYSRNCQIFIFCYCFGTRDQVCLSVPSDLVDTVA